MIALSPTAEYWLNNPTTPSEFLMLCAEVREIIDGWRHIFRGGGE